MGAPIGNKFWKNRSKHGRDKIFTDSQTMLVAAYDYFEWNAKNPWYRNEVMKSGDLAGTIIQVPTERPLTLEGLTSYWGVTRKYLDNFEKALSEEEQKDFLPVIAHIREMIYRQKFEGAAVGAFKDNIIIRDLGLKEKTELTGADGGPIKTEAVTQHTVVFKKFSNGDNPGV